MAFNVVSVLTGPLDYEITREQLPDVMNLMQ